VLAPDPHPEEGRTVEARIHDRFEARARVMKAMAHPTRLYIVDELASGERCVHELTELIGADMSTVSKHLSILKSVGIVTDDKRGAEVYYSLRMGCVLGFFDCIEAVLKGGDEATCGADLLARSKPASRRGGKR
jgi:ArsR family transcriptional regulator